MQSNVEIRNEAWRLLWKRGWFWKLLGAGILLQVCSQAIVTVVNGIVYRLGVFNLTAAMNMMQTRQPLPDLTQRIMWEFSSSTLLYFFFAFILGGITYYGNSVLLLRSAEDRGEGWLKAAFGGFKMPLELAWLSFRLSLVYFFWSLLAGIPCGAIIAAVVANVPTVSTVAEGSICGSAFAICAAIFIAVICIPFYRYRYLFRIKAEHPDWSAGECMKSCRVLTSGNKWRIFKHDCSYWRILLLALLPMLVMVTMLLLAVAGVSAKPAAGDGQSAVLAVFAIFGVLALIASYLAMIVFGVISVYYIGVGQTIFYREISREDKKEKQQKENNELLH